MPRPVDDDDDRPQRRGRRDEYDDEDDDDYDDRPRRRRPKADTTGGLIPYNNSQALTAYYVGVFGLIPCVGAFLGPAALVFGILGLRYARRHPQTSGKAHAVVGIVLGVLEILFNILGPVIFVIVSLVNNK